MNTHNRLQMNDAIQGCKSNVQRHALLAIEQLKNNSNPEENTEPGTRTLDSENTRIQRLLIGSQQIDGSQSDASKSKVARICTNLDDVSENRMMQKF